MFLQDDRERHKIGIVKFIISCIYPNNFNVIINIRFYLFLEKTKLPTFIAYRILYHVHGMEFAKNCKIGTGVHFPHPKGVLFTQGTEIERNCTVNGNVRFVGRHGKFPVIKENVFIGDSAILLGGVTIEKEVVIGAGSIVTKDFGPEVNIAGNPAKIINHYTKR
jgi:serine acetyltransferase